MFAENHHGINVLLLRLEDLGEPEQHRRLTRMNCCTWCAIPPARFSVPVLVCLCPSSPHFFADPAQARVPFATCVPGSTGTLDDFPGVQFLRLSRSIVCTPSKRRTIRSGTSRPHPVYRAVFLRARNRRGPPRSRAIDAAL